MHNANATHTDLYSAISAYRKTTNRSQVPNKSQDLDTDWYDLICKTEKWQFLILLKIRWSTHKPQGWGNLLLWNLEWKKCLWHHSHFTINTGKEEENKWVLSLVLNVHKHFENVTLIAAVTGNARSPIMESRVSGTASAKVNDKRKRCRLGSPATACGAVFFNFFVAVEPWTSVEVTHGTPCIDPCVQRRTRGRSYRVSTDSFP